MDSLIEAPEASAALTLVFSVLAVAVAAASVALVPRARRNLGHDPEAVRGTARTTAWCAAGWISLWLLVAASGLLARTDLRPPPAAALMGTVLLVGTLVGAGRVGGWLAAGLPTSTLIGLHAFRLPLELTMHRAAEEGVMPAQMSFEGLNFDIVSGALALAIFAVYRRREVPRPVAFAFAVVGSALLLVILGVALASTPMVRAFGDAPAQVNTWILFPPFVLLPTVLVLSAWVYHLVLWRRLLGRG